MQGMLFTSQQKHLPCRNAGTGMPFLHGAVYFSLDTTVHASSAMWCFRSCEDAIAGQKVDRVDEMLHAYLVATSGRF